MENDGRLKGRSECYKFCVCNDACITSYGMVGKGFMRGLDGRIDLVRVSLSLWLTRRLGV